MSDHLIISESCRSRCQTASGDPCRDGARSAKSAVPPSFVNVQVTIAYAPVDDALMVTMARLLGLCWAYEGERTTALAPEELAKLTGRPRSTLYRLLVRLREMAWIRVDKARRRNIIRAIVARGAGPVDVCAGCRKSGPNLVQGSERNRSRVGLEAAARSLLRPSQECLVERFFFGCWLISRTRPVRMAPG